MTTTLNHPDTVSDLHLAPRGLKRVQLWEPVRVTARQSGPRLRIRLASRPSAGFDIGSDRSCCATVLSFTASIASALQAVASTFPSSLFGPSGLAQPRRRRRPGQAEMVTQRLA